MVNNINILDVNGTLVIMFNARIFFIKHKKTNTSVFVFFYALFGGGGMNGITELAKLLKDRENKSDYSPMFGTIIALPDLKIRLGDKVILTAKQIKKCVSIDAQDENGIYKNIGKEVVLLPFANNQKFVLLGVVI